MVGPSEDRVQYVTSNMTVAERVCCRLPACSKELYKFRWHHYVCVGIVPKFRDFCLLVCDHTRDEEETVIDVTEPWLQISCTKCISVAAVPISLFVPRIFLLIVVIEFFCCVVMFFVSSDRQCFRGILFNKFSVENYNPCYMFHTCILSILLFFKNFIWNGVV